MKKTFSTKVRYQKEVGSDFNSNLCLDMSKKSIPKKVQRTVLNQKKFRAPDYV